jgi:hypothetical protein
MSLDRNLFTLNIVQNEQNPAVQDLVNPLGEVHYSKEREAGALYRINLFGTLRSHSPSFALTQGDSSDATDPMSQSMLASATAPHASSKHKTIELYNPTQVVEFKSTGTLIHKWCFNWEESVSRPFARFPTSIAHFFGRRHAFEWKRDECFLIRKPDPAVLVAITKDTAGRSRTTTVQILDYNLNR